MYILESQTYIILCEVFLNIIVFVASMCIACNWALCFALRFELPSLHILHVRCQFCVIRTVRKNLQFLPV